MKANKQVSLGQGKFKWRTLSLLFRTVGRTSRGICLGYQYGFDSGEMLDYVYENHARGKILVGKAIDRVYLNAIGWRAIRERKELLKRLLLREVAERRAISNGVSIVDLASGPGRYLLELCQELKSADGAPDGVAITCRDLDPKGLQWGREHAARLGLTNIRHEQGDACDPASLATIRPAPDIVVVSGLYELFTDPAPIQRSLRGIYSILKPGGKLVFTTQVHHPQLELIANVLVNREGRPWVMTCRSTETTEGWARTAGFNVVGSQLEPLQLFSVTIAQKAGVVTGDHTS